MNATARQLRMTAACGLAVGALASVALAGQTFTAPTTWTRPADLAQASASQTTFQHWNVFMTPGGPNEPDVANLNPAGLPDAFDAFAAADPNYDTSVTSSGNLYAGHSPVHMNVVIPNYGNTAAVATAFHVQFRFRGSETFDADGIAPVVTDLSRLFINGQLISSLPDFTWGETLRTSTGPNSNTVEQFADFSLPGNASSYLIEWTTPARGSASQDEIAVDTAVVVPEPALIGVVFGSLGVLIRRRRKEAAV